VPAVPASHAHGPLKRGLTATQAQALRLRLKHEIAIAVASLAARLRVSKKRNLHQSYDQSSTPSLPYNHVAAIGPAPLVLSIPWQKETSLFPLTRCRINRWLHKLMRWCSESELFG